MKRCDPDEGGRLKSLTGGKAPVHYQRTFQRELHDIYMDFNPAGLEDWVANNSTEVVEEAPVAEAPAVEEPEVEEAADEATEA